MTVEKSTSPARPMTRPAAPHCPACEADGARLFYELERVPVHSVHLLADRRTARGYPTGDIRLAFCSRCGFIWNTAFDAGRVDYGAGYESTQAFSGTFGAFQAQLAADLVERFGLRDKRIVEIGCGNGEFLQLLCEIGGNSGVGFDPAHVRGRVPENPRLRFVSTLVPTSGIESGTDFICCKMTLEHIPRVADLARLVRRAVRDPVEPIVFFQVPEATRIVREAAFWDIYYEHCSYFTPDALTGLFERADFTVIDVWLGYGDQYVMIAARPKRGSTAPRAQAKETHSVAQWAASFAERVQRASELWKRWLERRKSSGRRVVLWGGGSKAVAFLTTLRVDGEIDCVVDINPHRQGTYLPGTGHRIVGPDFLTSSRPDFVVVMNPLYRLEIRNELDQRGLRPTVLTIEELPGD